MHGARPLLTVSAAAFALACGGNPEPTPPPPAAATEAPRQAPAQPSADRVGVAGETLTDARALELARGYVEHLQAGTYGPLWDRLTPDAKERFGTLEQFLSEGQRVMNDLGREVAVVSEAVEAPRAGMQADKLYIRVSRYERSEGPVRLMMGLKNDGWIVGMQVRPAE